MRISDGSSDVCSSDLVGGPEHLERGDRRVASTERAGDLARRRVADDGVLHERHLHVEHADVDLPALAGDGPVVQGGVDADRKSVVKETRSSVRVNPGGRRKLTKKQYIGTSERK